MASGEWKWVGGGLVNVFSADPHGQTLTQKHFCTEDFEGSENTLYDITLTDTCHCNSSKHQE